MKTNIQRTGFFLSMLMLGAFLATPNTSATAEVKAGPIEQLVDKLSRTHGLWVNGVSPIIDLPANTSIEQVVSNVFQKTGFEKGHVTKHRILEARPVKILPFTNENYIAVLTETDFAGKIVLLKYEGGTLGWWSRVFDVEENNRAKDELKSGPLRVVVTPSATEVRLKEPFSNASRREYVKDKPKHPCHELQLGSALEIQQPDSFMDSLGVFEELRCRCEPCAP